MEIYVNVIRHGDDILSSISTEEPDDKTRDTKSNLILLQYEGHSFTITCDSPFSGADLFALHSDTYLNSIINAIKV